MNEEEKQAIEYLKTRLYGNEDCKYIDVAQEDLRIFINLVDRKEKDIEGWKKYCEEIEEEQIEKNNKNCELEFEVEKLQKENEELKSDNLEYQRIQDIFDKRTYRKKYLEERRKEEPNLLYPDTDEIYRRYYELQKENQQLRNEYRNIQQDGYIRGRAEEQQKAEQIIYESYISKQIIKNKIEELSKTKGDLATHIAVSERIRALQEILEESEGSKDGEN